MDPVVIGLVALSAVLHVGWNVRLKAAGDPLVAAAIGLGVGALVLVPLGAAAWLIDGSPPLPVEGIALGLLSGAVEAAYFGLLAAAYRRGDLSVVYPIARGTAPLLLVAVGVLVLGERLGPAGAIGVVALLTGFLALQRPWRALRPDTAVGFALATGVAIAMYTSIDRVGTRLIDPIPYAAILWTSGAVVLGGWLALLGRRRGATPRPAREAIRSASVVGVLTVGAYLLVLYALSVAPLTAVAPLRESATVVAATWGAVRLGEAGGIRDAARRIVASAVIVVGAVLLALDA